MVSALPLQGRQRSRTPLQPPQAPLHEICPALGPHRLRQRPLHSRLLGAIHPPAQAAHRRRQSDLVHPDRHGGLAVFLEPRGPTAVRAHDAGRGGWPRASPQERRDSLALDNRHHRLTEGRDRLKAFLASAALVQSLARGQR